MFINKFKGTTKNYRELVDKVVMRSAFISAYCVIALGIVLLGFVFLKGKTDMLFDAAFLIVMGFVIIKMLPRTSFNNVWAQVKGFDNGPYWAVTIDDNGIDCYEGKLHKIIKFEDIKGYYRLKTISVIYCKKANYCLLSPEGFKKSTEQQLIEFLKGKCKRLKVREYL